MEFPRLQSRVSASSSSSSSYIPPHKTQLHPRMQPLSLSPPNSSKAHKNPHKLLLLFISISLLPFLFYLFSLYRSIHLSSKFTPPASHAYGLILHIGSSRSQIRVFETLDRDSGTPIIAKGSDSLKIPNGLSGVQNDSGGAGRLVLELIEFAKLKVPKSEWKNTVVQLMVSGDGGGDVLDECRHVLRESDFLFENDYASVLSGEDEGIYLWVALNFVLGTLGKQPQDTSGIVELDGSSVQITYATREPSQVELSRTIRLGGVTYRLYTQSLPQFSQEAAWKTLLEIQNSQGLLDKERTSGNPCMPRGYVNEANARDGKLLHPHAIGNFTACRFEVLELLKRSKGECMPPACKESLVDLKGKTSSRRGFFYISKFLGPHPRGSISELESIGQHICEGSWDNIKTEHNDIDDVDLSRSCFSHAYAVALLHDNLGVPFENERVKLKSDGMSGTSIPLDWTLGAFVYLMTADSLDKLEGGSEFRDQIVRHESVTYFFMFAVLLVGVLLAAFFVMKLRKPQMKTIYDLEKGQYIVTRVPR